MHVHGGSGPADSVSEAVGDGCGAMVGTTPARSISSPVRKHLAIENLLSGLLLEDPNQNINPNVSRRAPKFHQSCVLDSNWRLQLESVRAIMMAAWNTLRWTRFASA